MMGTVALAIASLTTFLIIAGVVYALTGEYDD